MAGESLSVTIPTNDTPILSIAPTILTLNEGQTTQITITANTTVTENITITLDDNNQDQITGIPSNITIQQGQASTTFEITVIDDITPERSQDITITLSEISGFAELGDTNTATITIPTSDVDLSKPFITAILDTKQLEEGQATTLTIMATQITTLTTLSLSIEGPLAQPINNHLITFTPDQISQTTQIMVQATDDNRPSLSQPATLTLNVDVNTQLPTNQFSLSITPDPKDQYQVGFEQANLTVTEGTTQSITLVRIVPDSVSSPTTITVNLNNQNPDQIKLSTTTITFDQQTTTQIITVSVLDDTQPEIMETYPIDIILPTNTPAVIITKTLSITVPANDPPILTITPKQLTLEEGQTTQLTITANPAIIENITITLSNNSRGKITGIPSQITLQPGLASTVFNITATDDDIPDFNNVAVFIVLVAVEGLAQIGATNTAIITIPANDTPTLSIAPTKLTLIEGQTTQITITANPVINEDITITLDDKDQDQITGVPSQINLPAGQASTVFSITAMDDTVAENAEVITITLSDFSVVSPSEELSMIRIDDNANTATITIPLNDAPILSIAPAKLTLTEGQTTQITIIANPAIIENTTITLNDNNQDQITGVPSQIILPAGQTSTVFSITVTDDTTPENAEDIAIAISRVEGLAQIGATNTVTITIPPNDAPILSIAPAKLTLTEGQTTQITITANPAVTENTTITINDNNQDQITGVPSQIILPAGQASTVFSITVTDDTAPELGQDIIITLNSVSGFTQIGAANTVTVTIPPNDTPTLSIAPTKLTLIEGQTTQITITANLAVTENTTITLNDNNQDQITGVPSQIILPAGQASTVFSITVTDDTAPESTQTIAITLSGVTGFVQLGATNTVTIIIPTNDIDTSKPLITAILDTNQLTEGDTTTLTITATQITKATTLSFEVAGSLRSAKHKHRDYFQPKWNHADYCPSNWWWYTLSKPTSYPHTQCSYQHPTTYQAIHLNHHPRSQWSIPNRLY